MDQKWVPIEGFRRYVINSSGDVFDTLREVKITPNPVTGGALAVRIKNDHGVYHTRSLKVLVAEIFVDADVDPEYFDVRIFDTPILLDNDQNNVFASNIKWRPRWFAWRYSHQFSTPKDYYYRGPLVNCHSGLKFENVMSVGVYYGFLFENVYWAAKAYEDGETDAPEPVWPLGKVFAFIN